MKKIIAQISIISLVLWSVALVPVSQADSITVGNDATVRPVVDTYHNFTIIDTNNPASANAELTSFDYYAKNANPFRFVIIDTSDVVQWVSVQITPSVVPGQNTYSPVSSVFVDTGWNVGLYFSLSGTVPFEYNGAADPAHYEPNNAGLPNEGDTLFYQGSSKRVYSFVAYGVTLPYGEITAPEVNEVVGGEVDFTAYLIDDDYDYADWAVRKGTCAAGTNTVFGNVDGFSDSYVWVLGPEPYTYNFSATADTSAWIPGMYCFIFNPREDSGEVKIRLTRQFYVADGYVSGGGQMIEEIGPKPKDNYKISFGGWVADLGSTLMGEWEVNLHKVSDNNLDGSKFHTTEITEINFFTGNDPSCHSAINFTAVGEWNHMPGYSMIFRAGDAGSPNTKDTTRVTIYNPGGGIVYDTHSAGEFNDESHCVGGARTGLDNGNITILLP